MSSKKGRVNFFKSITAKKADAWQPMRGTVLRDFWVRGTETKIMFDTAEFLDYCGKIGTPLEFLDIHMKPDAIGGQFYPKRLPEMLEFCEWFPEFSIISKMPNRAMVNRPRLGAHCYYLAKCNRSAERIVCHSAQNNDKFYTVAGIAISPKRPEVTVEQFWRALGMWEESDKDGDES